MPNMLKYASINSSFEVMSSCRDTRLTDFAIAWSLVQKKYVRTINHLKKLDIAYP